MDTNPRLNWNSTGTKKMKRRTLMNELANCKPIPRAATTERRRKATKNSPRPRGEDTIPQGSLFLLCAV